ncbi:copper resistance protein NlpE [uncultured Pontibacter sp.]|uniref:copper resistance protein NlpE n=1 Tax=uncultured Pontibacter sp. TaxID=453356 RepID=UPI002615E869|nr:copper resistance protein NlpE [uncultured Pontibacter sp.]
MKVSLLLILPLVFLSISCSSNKASASASIPNAIEATAELVSQSETVVGTWQGMLPCADCPGISYTLQIFPDQTYQEKLVYLERSAEAVEQAGAWEVDASGVLNLEKPDGSGMIKFEIMPDALVMLDTVGKRINSDMAAMYRLKRINQK